MKHEVYFAALIRGNIIEKTKLPWIVSYEPDAASPAELNISITNENEAEEKIKQGFKNYSQGKIPSKVNISCNGKDYSYVTAPDFKSSNAAEAAVSRSNAAKSCCDKQALKNRIALVTGGAQGFGEEIVRGLVDAGAIVFIADLNIQGAEKLAQTLNKEHGKTTAFAAEVNVADEATVEKMFETIALKAGGLDLCISNAGVLRAAPILEQDMASFRFVTDINYTAFAIISKHCGLLMKAQNLCAPAWFTDIIQINSKSGLEGSNKNGSYAGSKFGSIGLVQSFAKELVEYHIKVNAVCPGNFFDGPLWSDPENGLFVQYLKTGKVPGAKTVEHVKAHYEAMVPMGRGCTGPDVIRAVLYLVEQVYETGQALPVTGGQVMLN